LINISGSFKYIKSLNALLVESVVHNIVVNEAPTSGRPAGTAQRYRYWYPDVHVEAQLQSGTLYWV
jgi:hypothetical protein